MVSRCDVSLVTFGLKAVLEELSKVMSSESCWKNRYALLDHVYLLIAMLVDSSLIERLHSLRDQTLTAKLGLKECHQGSSTLSYQLGQSPFQHHQLGQQKSGIKALTSSGNSGALAQTERFSSKRERLFFARIENMARFGTRIMTMSLYPSIGFKLNNFNVFGQKKGKHDRHAEQFTEVTIYRKWCRN